MSNKNKRALLLISILACFIGCVADYLLLYSPKGNYHVGDYEFLLDIPKERLMWGHYLGILFIPIELLGFWVVSQTFSISGKNKPLLFFAAITFIMFSGVVYHGTLAFVGAILREAPNGTIILESVRNLFEPLSVIMAFFFVLFTIYLIYSILKKKTRLPKWIIWFNPAFVYLLVLGIYFTLPIIGNVLMVAGFNFANAIFLTACAYELWNTEI